MFLKSRPRGADEVPGRARCFFFLDDVYPAGGNIGGDTYPRNEQQTLVVHAHREGRIHDAHSLDQQYKRSMALFPLIMLVAVLHDPKKLGSEMRENRKNTPPGGNAQRDGWLQALHNRALCTCSVYSLNLRGERETNHNTISKKQLIRRERRFHLSVEWTEC